MKIYFIMDQEYYYNPTFIVAMLFLGFSGFMLLILCCKYNIDVIPVNRINRQQSQGNTAPNTPDTSLHDTEDDIEIGYLNESK
jgi:hypothetical protein